MNRQPDVELVMRDYFNDDGLPAPDHVLDVIEERIMRQPQQRAWRVSWRDSHVNSYLKPLLAVAAIVVVALFGVDAHRQQLPQQLRRGAGAARQDQGVALLLVAGGRIRPRLRQSRHHFKLGIARGIEQRRDAVRVMGVAIGAGLEQGADHVDIAAGAGLHQRGALLEAASIDACLVPQ